MPPSKKYSISTDGFAVFLFSLASLVVVYGHTVAPDVTFEDSGELITAAGLGGVAHPPGYPLFTMIAHGFTFLPFGTVAYRVNLVSVVFMAIGCALTGMAVRSILTGLWKENDRNARWLINAAAWSAAMLAGLALDVWRQAVITEVYGLHATFVGLIVLLCLRWFFFPDRRSNYYGGIALVFALSMTNHPTTLLLAPAILVAFVVEDWSFMRNWKHQAFGVVCFTAGLIPLIYLPIASGFDPVLDWGNPENFTNFWRVITRAQYESDIVHSARAFFSQFRWYRELLLSQWLPLVLVWTIPAAVVLFRKKATVALFLGILLIGLGPLTTWITNFDLLTMDPAVIRENKALVAVFYIPSYMVLAALIAIGIFLSTRWLPPLVRVPSLVTISIVLIAWTGVRNHARADMSRHRFARAYAENLMAVVPPGSIVFTNWDPFSFPLMYLQYVEKWRTDVVVVDQELLRRSWYVEGFARRHPQVAQPVRPAIERFLDAVRPFEAHEPYDDARLQSTYNALLNTLIDSSYARGRNVFLMYDPDETIAASYFKESVLSAIRLRKTLDTMTAIDESRFRFETFKSVRPGDERFAVFFKTYYGRLHYARAYIMELRKQRQAAHRLYGQALEFLGDNREFSGLVEEGLERTD